MQKFGFAIAAVLVTLACVWAWLVSSGRLNQGDDATLDSAPAGAETRGSIAGALDLDAPDAGKSVRRGVRGPLAIDPTASAPVEAPARLVGRVQSQGLFDPIPAARLLLVWVEEGRELRVSSRTDETGAFALEDLPLGVELTLKVEAKSYQPAEVALEPFGQGEARDLAPILLERKSELTGVVVDTQGIPVTGAVVLLHETRMRSGLADALKKMDAIYEPETPLERRTTDKLGLFNFGEVKPGNYRIEIQAEGFATLQQPDVWVNPQGVRAVLRFVLGDPATLEVRVVDHEGSPLSGVLLSVQPQPDNKDLVVITQRTIGVTDDDGRSSFDRLATGTYWVFAKIPGGLQTLQKDVVAPGSIEIKLPRGSVLSGTVTRADDFQPVPGVGLTFIGDGQYQIAESGADGKYTIGPLKEGRYTLLLGGTDLVLAPSMRESVKVGKGEQTWDISLAVGAVIQGQVVDIANGKGIPGVWVSASTAPGFGSSIAGQKTDKEGRFRLSGVALKKTKLFVTAYDHVVFGEQMAQVKDGWESIAPGEEVAGVVIRMARRTRIAGRVLDEVGAPIAGARVSAQMRSAWVETLFGGNPSDCMSDKDGRYSIAVAPTENKDAEVTGNVTHKDYAPAGFFVRGPRAPGERIERDVTLERPGVVIGRVVDTRGKPIPNVVVTASFAEKGLAPTNDFEGARLGMTTITDTLGNYALTLPARKLILKVRAPNLMLVAGPTVAPTPEAGGELRVKDFVMARKTALSGRVVDQAGNPLSRLMVTAELVTAATKWTTAIEVSDGRFRFDAVPEGDYDVRVEVPGRYSARFVNQVSEARGVAGGTRDLLFTFERKSGR